MKIFRFRIKNLLIPIMTVMIIALIGYAFFLSRVNFYNDISLKFNLINNDSSIDVFAKTPTGRKVNFVKADSNTFHIEGCYDSIFFSVNHQYFVENINSVLFKAINCNREIKQHDFLNYWKLCGNKNDMICYGFKSETISDNWIRKAIFSASALLHLPWCSSAMLLLIISLGLLGVFIFYYEKIKSKLPQFSLRRVIFYCLGLLTLYIIIFFSIVKFEDKVPLSGDYPVYQIEAVNFIKGCDLNEQTIFEKYKFDSNNVDSAKYRLNNWVCELNNRTWVPPAYPVFLSIIYKIFGVSPLIVRYIQLLLLIIVAAFLPLLLFLKWHFKGFFIGFLAGLIFIITYYNISKEIMTEPFMIFFSFLTLFSISYFELRNTVLSAVSLGIILAIALLVKGIIVFVILFYFIHLTIQFLKKKNKIHLKNFITLIVVFLISLSSWIVYSNLYDGLFQKVKASKKELSEVSIRISNAFNNYKSPSLNEINLDSLIEINKTLEVYFPEIKFPFFSTISNNTTQINLYTQKMLNEMSIHIIQMIEDLQNSSYFKLGDKDYVYLNTERLVIISVNHTQEIYESNNAKCIDGDIHPDELIKYTYDANYNDPSFLRVFKFYYNNPHFIPVIFPKKLYNAFHSFPYFMILMALIISNFILLLIKKRMLLSNKITNIFLSLLVPFFLYCGYYSILGFIICFMLAVITIGISLIWKKSLLLFNIPISFNLFILNFILITLIFFGNERITAIIDFIIITSAVYYLFEYYYHIYGKSSHIERQ